MTFRNLRFKLNETLEMEQKLRADDTVRKQFISQDMKKLANSGDKEKAKSAKITWDGDEWTLLKDGDSILHGPDSSHFKWVAKGGRELIITKDGELEKRPEYTSTYNFATDTQKFPPGPHATLDVFPWVDMGNLPDDSTSKWTRNRMLYMKHKPGIE